MDNEQTERPEPAAGTPDKPAAPQRSHARRWIFIVAGAAAIGAGAYYWTQSTPHRPAAPEKRTERAEAAAEKVQVELSAAQLRAITIAPAGTAPFEILRRAVGNIDFDQNALVQVFTPYQGRIIAANVNVGDRVEKGQVLFTVDSADLLQASSALITAAGVLNLQNRTLKRVTDTLKGGGGAQKDVDQAVSDQQTAEGVLRAARDALRIYGKTDEDADRIVAERRADSTLTVRSPIDGYVTARTAAPGLFILPGSAPAPITLADQRSMWMIANVPESDAASLRVGQAVQARVSALPGRAFDGTVGVIGATVDAQTRRTMVRSVISDPDRLLRAGMFADFTIRIEEARQSLAVPANAVVREGDGGMTVWLTTDRRVFEKRNVKVGLRQNGFVQILDGINAGDLVVTDGAIFLTNKLVGGPTD